VDAFGRLSYPVLYVYPIRLLAEAKCYEKTVRLPIVQNFTGVIKDIPENYFIQDKISREEILFYNRYTDCGAIFSASDFTIDAQRFALAHGITMISYENNPILRTAIDALYDLMYSIDIPLASKRKSYFSDYIYQRQSSQRQQSTYRSQFILREARNQFSEVFRFLYNSLARIKTSAFAIAVGENPEFQYPIHMISYESIPENMFDETDTFPFKVHYSASETGVAFRVNPTDTDLHFHFSLPRSIYQDYFAQRRMLDFKQKFLRQIELPTTIRGLRRILRLELDNQWIEEQRERSRHDHHSRSVRTNGD
jgi:hypothetical protein